MRNGAPVRERQQSRVARARRVKSSCTPRALSVSFIDSRPDSWQLRSSRRPCRFLLFCICSAASPRPSCPATSPRVEPSAKAARRGATNDFFLPHNFRRALRARIGRSHEPCNFIRLCPSAPRFGATRAARLPASSSDACCSVSTQRHRHGVQSLRRASGNPSLCRQA